MSSRTTGTARRGLRLCLVVAAAFLAGFAIRGCLGPATEEPAAAVESGPATAAEVWTCSMHPHIRLPAPGKCPICEMPLIPAASAATGAAGAPHLGLSEHAMAMANIETVPVTRRRLTRELRASGKIRYSEASLATITARVDGYAERLFVDFTGVSIKTGDHLAEVYSPELLVAQQELLFANRQTTGATGGAAAEMARVKLRRWGLTDAQLDELVEKGTIAERVTLFSPIEGTVIEKRIVQNSAFKAGDVLYRIANLDTVWVYLDIYEIDLPWVRTGQKVALTAEALPGKIFEGRVTFVEPLVNDATRTVRVPVHVANAGHALKPGMFVSAAIRAELGPDGQAAATGIEGRFTCPMHPQVLQDVGGKCPICEMPLEQIPGAPAAAKAAAAPAFHCPMKCEGDKTYAEEGSCPVCGMRLVPVPAAVPAAAETGGDLLSIPVEAVLDSGTRKLVYVLAAPGLFEPREVVLGPRSGDFFPVLHGLGEGDLVVRRGGFLIDSQFQITGHPSLFQPGGLKAGTMVHQGHAAGQPPMAADHQDHPHDQKTEEQERHGSGHQP